VSICRVGGSWKIHYGEHIDFEFQKPTDVDSAAVVRSVLKVRGYYERYLDLQVQAHGDRSTSGNAEVRA
jgi:hypothetical protein